MRGFQAILDRKLLSTVFGKYRDRYALPPGIFILITGSLHF